ncbi:substrate-binding domain-containing protein [Pseudoroseicyclus sp. CXY001]|uniref:substrate-binding domain-containing protein n=1 Tax=Pseudoroseicyclus sp. CXY001 TaxID=3242492 RepID=UPI00358DC0D0
MINRRALLGTAAMFAAATLTAAPALADPAEALRALQDTVLSVGPNGEEPASAADVTLTDEELAQIREMGATAAIVMHYGGNDWSQAQINGLQTRFEEMGIEVIAVTDAGFRAEKQVADIETIMAQSPDIIVSIPTDPVATAAAYRAAAEAGVHLVFMDNVPSGFVAGEDYISSVSADNYGNGVAAAHLMAQALDEEGQIGLVYHAADFFVTQQRYEGFKATIASDYPGIEIVAEQGIGGPDFSGDADRAANAMLTSNPGLDGIWAVWDVPAEGVIAAARASGLDDLVITTIDLGENVAINMAQGGYVYGLGAQRPYDQGVTEATLAGYGLLGKDAPAFVALPALPVTRDTLLDGWQAVYAAPATDNIVSSMD